MPNFLALKFPESKTNLVVFIHRTTCLGYAGTTMNLQIVSNTQKIPSKSSHPKKILAKFSYPKNPDIINFKPKKILLSSRSLKIWSNPLGSKLKE